MQPASHPRSLTHRGLLHDLLVLDAPQHQPSHLADPSEGRVRLESLSRHLVYLLYRCFRRPVCCIFNEELRSAVMLPAFSLSWAVLPFSLPLISSSCCCCFYSLFLLSSSSSSSSYLALSLSPRAGLIRFSFCLSSLGSQISGLLCVSLRRGGSCGAVITPGFK